jgi:large subunit ribosomal protein L3
VTQVKTLEKDKYNAVQIGFGARREKNINKAQLGHTKDLGMFRYLKEFHVAGDYKRGDIIDVSIFTPGDKVQISAISKGKGFQGVVKRHGFAGGRRSHGQKHSEREPGSIGATGPQKVLKGLRMAGRMGGDRITVKNLKIVAVDPASNTLLIKGALPGHPGTFVEISAQ